jgi:hypothetical protein
LSRRALLVAALWPAAAAAQVPDALELAGQPLLALVQHPAVGPRLRVMAQGHQRALSDAVRGDGPPLAVAEGRWVHGRARAGERRVLLALDAWTEQVALILYDGAQALAFVPPRGAPWPAALRGAVEAFSPQVAAALRFP